MGRLELWRTRVSEQRALIALGVSVATAGPALLAEPAGAQLSPGCSQSGSDVTCFYTSGSNEVEIPAGVASVQLWAAGGVGATSGDSTKSGS